MTRGNRREILRGALLAACLVIGLTGPAARASELAPEEGGEDAIVALPGRLDVENDSHARSVWAWPAGNRLYRMAGQAPDAGFTHLASYDTETLAEAGRVELRPRGYKGQTARGLYGIGLSNAVAIDHEEGRLFVAYQTNNFAFATASTASGNPQAPPAAPGSQPCTLDSNHALCLGGFHIFDATTLESQGMVPFQGTRIDALVMEPVLRATSYAPSRGAGDTGKLLVLIEELQHNRSEGSPITSGTENTIPRRNGAAVAYALQIDPESRSIDWITRVDGCRSSREQRPGAWAERSNPAVIFRSGDMADPAIWVGCHASNSAGTAVRIPLDVEGMPHATPVEVSAPGALPTADDMPPAPAAPVRQAPAQQTFAGPDRTVEIVADPSSERILMRVDDNAEVWWVFDGKVRGFVGAIGIGGYSPAETSSGFDPVAGRLYVLGSKKDASLRAATPGGLFVANIRPTPLAQALRFEEFASWAVGGNASLLPIVVDREAGEKTARLYIAADSLGTSFAVFEDRLPVAVPEELDDFEGRTLDIDEAEGVTGSAFDGAARGYAARVLLVGGAEAMTRVGSVDPLGLSYGVQDGSPKKVLDRNGLTAPHKGLLDAVPPPRCRQEAREVIFGSVGPDGPVVLDVNGTRAAVQPVILDQTTQADLEGVVSRCSGQDWEGLWSVALFGRPPVGEPKAGDIAATFAKQTADCLSTDQAASGKAGDPVAQSASGAVQCDQEAAAGHSQVRGATVPGVTLGNMLTSFRVYRDPGRGVVSRVEAVVRGVGIDNALRIASVRAVAESWANGRRQPVPAAQREPGYDSNCDSERTAGTCFQRQIFGVWTPAWSCGPCGDEQALVAGLSRALGANASVRLRNPDVRLAKGAESGFIAAIQKPDSERFADLALNNDLMQTVVPALEIIRYAPQGRPSVEENYYLGLGPRGRQIYQFAGVEVSSSYGISCLLVYDEAANTCAEPSEPPGAITVSLSDSDGKPLAGGGFEVRQDVDADGVLGLKDTLLPEGACVTADDGVGTCTLDNLQPGSYLVSQVAAPPGYAKSAEPFVVELASGEQRTVAFTNVSNVSTIDLKVTDENGAPLSGAAFAAYPDADSDGKVAPDAKPAAECTTDGQGVCQMKVPAGSYVLVQTAAPGGLEGIEPVPFTFASGGQVAAVTVVNYPPGAPAQPAPPASPVYTPPVDYAPPTEIVDDYTPVPDVPVIVEPPAVSVPERIGGTVTQVIRAPGDALRLLARDPKQAVAWTAALALFCLAVMAVRRRQQAIALIQG